MTGGDSAWRARERARRWRQGLWQIGIALCALVLLASLIANLHANLQARQIRSGFGFLADPAGFNIGEVLFGFTARDSYLLAFAAGLTNTLRVALAGIVLASLLGLLVCTWRLSRHALLNTLGSSYVEVLRNTPLAIQLLALYLLLTELLPESSAAWTIEGVVLLSKQGLQFAVPVWGAGPAGVIGWSRPLVDGFLISGGAALTPEFLALWLGLSLYTSAFIAELLRAGALAVPIGQTQAALALGLSRRQTLARVVLPQALRLALPPLASQYMNLIKNSSLAVLIGYPDLVAIANTSINQNGQALEVVVIIMAVYLSLNLVVALVMGALNARVTRAPR